MSDKLPVPIPAALEPLKERIIERARVLQRIGAEQNGDVELLRQLTESVVGVDLSGCVLRDLAIGWEAAQRDE